jgi:ribosome-associated protein
VIAKDCCNAAIEKRAEHVTMMDLRKLVAPTDFFVICTGTGDRHVRAIADAIIGRMTLRGLRPWHVEGYSACTWILIDYVDVVIHIFNSETRKFYSLETLWGDAPTEEVKPRIRKARKA